MPQTATNDTRSCYVDDDDPLGDSLNGHIVCRDRPECAFLDTHELNPASTLPDFFVRSDREERTWLNEYERTHPGAAASAIDQALLAWQTERALNRRNTAERRARTSHLMHEASRCRVCRRTDVVGFRRISVGNDVSAELDRVPLPLTSTADGSTIATRSMRMPKAYRRTSYLDLPTFTTLAEYRCDLQALHGRHSVRVIACLDCQRVLHDEVTRRTRLIALSAGGNLGDAAAAFIDGLTGEAK